MRIRPLPSCSETSFWSLSVHFYRGFHDWDTYRCSKVRRQLCQHAACGALSETPRKLHPTKPNVRSSWVNLRFLSSCSCSEGTIVASACEAARRSWQRVMIGQKGDGSFNWPPMTLKEDVNKNVSEIVSAGGRGVRICYFYAEYSANDRFSADIKIMWLSVNLTKKWTCLS